MHPQYLVDSYMKKNTGKSIDEAKLAVEDRIMAILNIEGALDSKYGVVKRHLANQKVHGVDIYPESKSQAQTLLAKFITDDGKKSNNTKTKGGGGSSTNNEHDEAKINVSFFQDQAPPVEGPPVAGTDGKLQPEVRCHKCGRLGHKSPVCSAVTGDGFQGFQYLTFSQNHFVN